MKRLKINHLHLWQFENLGRETSIRHFVTDRNSHDVEGEFTLSLSSTPNKQVVTHNRMLVSQALGIDATKLFFPSQVHLTRVVHVTKNTQPHELEATDALITNERNVGLAVMSADCVPIILFDKVNHAIAAVHSGWRGTVARILEKTLHQMQKTFGTKGRDIIAGIGPSVSQESYEVGEEVVEAVQQSFTNANAFMIPQPNRKAKLDLWKANTQQLIDFGVDPSFIEVSDLCTVKNNQYFFSARKGDTGRFAAGIVLTQ